MRSLRSRRTEVVPLLLLLIAATDNWFRGIRYLDSLPRLDQSAAVLLTMYGLLVVARRPGTIRQVATTAWLLSLALIVWSLAAGMFDSSWDKPLRVIGLFVGGLLAGAMVLDGPESHKKFARLVGLLGFIAVALALTGINVSDTGGQLRWGRLVGFAGGTISIARAGGAAATVSLVRLVSQKKTSTFDLLVVAASGLAILRSGSRGPGLAAAIAILAVIVALQRDTYGPKRERYIHWPKVFFGTLFGVFVVLVAGELASARALTQLFTLVDVDSTARVGFWKHALDTGLTTPFGVGIGSFDYQGARYPHNIALEIFAEGGWLVFGLFVAACVSAIRLNARRVGIAAEPLALLVYSLGAALVSFDLPANVLFAIMLGGCLRRSPHWDEVVGTPAVRSKAGVVPRDSMAS